MFRKFLNFVSNIEIKLKKLEDVTIRFIILALLLIVFITMLSSGFLAVSIVLLMILAVIASIIQHLLEETKQNGDH